ncbi:MAG: serine hydrolase domain-containing protein [Xanthomonadales bacterium]|nr:serine hydrolase domain-containing protein [Xanthomonadales bacterium]
MKIRQHLLTALIVCMASVTAHGDENYDNALALVDAWLEVQRAYDRVPGMSVAIVHDQELLWSGAKGYADLERQLPASTDTIYGICSISKLFTGIAALQLRDQGRYRLDDPVARLLPWFDLKHTDANSPVITLEGLLTHSAGVPRESDSPYWMGPDFTFPSREAVRARMAEQATLWAASEYYQYSNLGLTLVGEIVAEQSGQDYEAYVRAHIIEPMGLDDTDTGFPEDGRAARIATGYGTPTRAGEVLPLPRYDARGITPAAGFSSTALDLARFASWQFRVRDGGDDGILAGNTLKEMQRIHWMDWDFGSAWGLAFGIYNQDGRTVTGHGGHCPGFATRIFIDPLSRFGVVVMSNRNAVDVSGYASSILDILDAGGAPTAPAEEAAEPTVDFTEFLGAYDLYPWGNEALVVQWEDGLSIAWVPSMTPLENMEKLQHIEGDTFKVVRDDESLADEVVFIRDESGTVVSMKRHSLIIPRR